MNTAMWIVVLIYLVASVVAGAVIAKKKAAKDLSGYFNSGGTLSPWVMAFSFASTSLSGLLFLGGPTQAYAYGYPTFIFGTILGTILGGCVLGNLLIGKPMRYISTKKNIVTPVDLLEEIYSYNKLRYVAVPMIIIASTVSASVQWQCLGNLFSLLGLNYKWGVIIGVLVVAIYTNIGGNSGSAIVGAVQTIICVVSCIIVAVIAARACGGFTAMNTQFGAIDPGLVQAISQAYPLPRSITFMIGNMAGLGQPYLLVKFFQVKDTRALPKALPLTIIGTFFTCIVVVIGVSMRVLEANGTIAGIEHIDSIVPQFVAQIVNPSSIAGPVIGGLVIAAALSAIMSTASALTLSVSSAAVKDVYIKWMHHEDMPAKKQVRASKLTGWVVIIISMLLALWPVGTIFYIGFAAATMFGTAFAPSIIGGLRWRRSTKYGAMCSMCMGIVHFVFFVLNSTGVFPWPFNGKLEMNGVMIVISVIVYIVVSLLTPAQEKPLLPAPEKELKPRVRSQEG